jgi:acetyl-CoA carboxylase carboxyltransferase component
VMGPDGAVNIVYRKEIAEAEKPAAKRAQLIKEYADNFANPYVAATRGYPDDVIEPKETRPRLIAALKSLANKRDTNPPRKHNTMPL